MLGRCFEPGLLPRRWVPKAELRTLSEIQDPLALGGRCSAPDSVTVRDLGPPWCLALEATRIAWAVCSPSFVTVPSPRNYSLGPVLLRPSGQDALHRLSLNGDKATTGLTLKANVDAEGLASRSTTCGWQDSPCQADSRPKEKGPGVFPSACRGFS